MYLAEADPWTHPGDERAASALADIIESHRAISQRIAEEVLGAPRGARQHRSSRRAHAPPPGPRHARSAG
jgi:hypothetical protein